MRETIHVQPYVLATLLCERIIIEEKTRRKTLVGLFDRIQWPKFPTGHTFNIFVKMIDAAGDYRLRAEYVDLSNNQGLAGLAIGTISPIERLHPTEVVIELGVPIPHPGEYEFRIFANDAFLCRATFTADLLP